MTWFSTVLVIVLADVKEEVLVLRSAFKTSYATAPSFEVNSFKHDLAFVAPIKSEHIQAIVSF